MRFQYQKSVYGLYSLFNPIQNGVYILLEVSFVFDLLDPCERHSEYFYFSKPLYNLQSNLF